MSNVGQVDNLRRVGNPPNGANGAEAIQRRLATGAQDTILPHRDNLRCQKR
jgi:hypothetical protein